MQIQRKNDRIKNNVKIRGDWYVRMIIENRDVLEKYYVIPYIQEELLNKMVLKDSFYELYDDVVDSLTALARRTVLECGKSLR